MLTLRLLSGLCLESAEGPLHTRATQPRRLALLALLATAPEAGRTREKLIGYLWPETEGLQARKNLSDSLYVIHQDLGERAVLTGSDSLRLNLAEVATDVGEFEGLLERGELESAVALYAGPFLDGVHIEAGPEFEAWVDDRRQHYAQLYAEAVERLARAAEQRSDALEAAEWWARLSRHEPFSSHVTLQLVQALLAAGDPGEALNRALSHERLLREELEIEPPTQLLNLAEKIRGSHNHRDSGHRGPGSELSSPNVSTRRTEAAPTHQRRMPRLSLRWPLYSVLTVVALILALTSPPIRGLFQREGGRKKSVAVLRLLNLSQEANSDYFSDGITGEIISALSKIGDLDVKSRTSAMAFDGTGKSIREIGQELGVDAILEGEVQRGEESIRINVRLIDTRTDEQLWAERYDRRLGEVFKIQSDVARNIAAALRAELTIAERLEIGRAATTIPAAYDSYLRGNDYFLKTYEDRDLRIAEDYFKQAVALDSTFALAYARLAETHSFIYWFHFDHSQARIDAAREAAEQALALAPDSPESQRALGLFTYYCTLDYDRALEHLAAARSAKPHDAYVWIAIGAIHRRQGAMEEAISAFERALEIEPLSTIALESAAATCSYVGDFETAERYWDRAIAVSPDYPRLYGRKALLYLSWDGDIEKARTALRQAVWDIGPTADPWVLLGFLLTEVYDRRYDAALDRVSSLFPETLESQFFYLPRTLLFGLLQHQLGQSDLAHAYFDSARADLEARIQSAPEDSRLHSSLGIARAGLGLRADAIREGRLATELMPLDEDVRRGLYRLNDLAWIYTMVGEHEKAIDVLERILSTPGDITAARLRLDPCWDPLRDHERFQRLLDL